MKYTFNQHIHNYAVWTAARAVQRGFTSTVNIKSAIEAASLRDLIDKKTQFNENEFDAFHRETARKIIENLQIIDSVVSNKATYGRAAKIIAIYIKTISVIRDSGSSNLAKYAHPPIDRILLSNLHKRHNNLGFDKYTWTLLNEHSYFELIDKLRTFKYDYFWEVEEYWII